METALVLTAVLACCALALWRLRVRRKKGGGACARCPMRGTDRCGQPPAGQAGKKCEKNS